MILSLSAVCHTVTGGRLAEGAAKGTRFVRGTVFPTRVASSKHVSPLATVRSLGLFSTILKSRISLVATSVEVAHSLRGVRRRRQQGDDCGFEFAVVCLPARMRARTAWCSLGSHVLEAGDGL